MVKKKKEVKSKNKKSDSKLFAFLAVFLCIVGFIIALIARRDDKYVMYYAKQSLVLFIGFIIAGFIGVIPVVGWIVSPIANLILFILWIIALFYSASGNMKPTPIIGELGEKIKL